MKTKQILQTLGLLALSAVASSPLAAAPFGSAFTYQGRLSFGAGPALDGLYDFSFTLHDAATAGSTIGTAANLTAVPVSNGVFSAQLDFGAAAFTSGEARWLELSVNTNGVTPLALLNPRQRLSPTPQAIYAETAGIASGVASGAVTSAGIAPSAVDSESIQNSSIEATDLSPSLLNNTFWKLGGNASLPPGLNFLGTLGFTPLELRANNQPVLRLQPNATSPNMLGGHPANGISGITSGAFIGGGGATDRSNMVSGEFATIVGGHSQRAMADGALIGGGAGHTNSGLFATVGGGAGHRVSAAYAGIAAGASNQNHAAYGFIGGGGGNSLTLNSDVATIGGGEGNSIVQSPEATIGGGHVNRIQDAADGAVISGGYLNSIKLGGLSGAIGGGAFNLVDGSYASIGGGLRNAARNQGATIAGGGFNTNTALYGSIGGGSSNVAAGGYSTIAGGFQNEARGDGASVGGGRANIIEGDFPMYSTISGGAQNLIANNALASTIGGGVVNHVDIGGQWAVIAGGSRNTNRNTRGVISGGQDNLVTGSYGTIPGGFYNEATNSTLAAGSGAKARHRGSWVWADNAAGFDLSGDFSGGSFASTGTNQFLVRASGGVGINTNNPQATLHVRGNIAADALRAPGAGINTGTFAFTHRAPTGIVSHITTIDNPLCNNDPGAILVVTHNWTADTSANKYHPQVVGVYYASGRWNIFHEDNITQMEAGDAFNVLVIKP